MVRRRWRVAVLLTNGGHNSKGFGFAGGCVLITVLYEQGKNTGRSLMGSSILLPLPDLLAKDLGNLYLERNRSWRLSFFVSFLNEKQEI